MTTELKTTYDKVMQNAGKWLTVRQLAKVLAVHPDTIRRWAAKGLIKSVRHPANNYRLFLVEDLGRVEALKDES